jgi:hypothetical protein
MVGTWTKPKIIMKKGHEFKKRKMIHRPQQTFIIKKNKNLIKTIFDVTLEIVFV